MEEETFARMQQDLDVIKERNSRVEADKAWEVSATRRIAICILTYAVAATVLYLIGVQRFWLDAVLHQVERQAT